MKDTDEKKSAFFLIPEKTLLVRFASMNGKTIIKTSLINIISTLKETKFLVNK